MPPKDDPAQNPGTDLMNKLTWSAQRKFAVISPCGRFRYGLWRTWGEQAGDGTPIWSANFIMLNPSTADAELDDPTIRRCMGFARRWEMDGIAVTNLYPLRETDPRRMLRHQDRLGERDEPSGVTSVLANDRAIRDQAERAAIVLLAWGVNAEHNQAQHVLALLRRDHIPTYCLGLTTQHHPRHPLHLPSHALPRPFPAR
jgi:hypothetical protein